MKQSALLLCVLVSASAVADTVLYDGRVNEVSALADPTDLWIPTADLNRTTGFELKPEGACIDDICVPVRQDVDSELLVRRRDNTWFNVTELADRLEQPYVADHDARLWSFGSIPVREVAFYERAIAPDFTLKDRDGNAVQLSDFKGKKVMLLTWASW